MCNQITAIVGMWDKVNSPITSRSAIKALQLVLKCGGGEKVELLIVRAKLLPVSFLIKTARKLLPKYNKDTP